MKKFGSAGARALANEVLAEFGNTTIPVAVERIIKRRGITIQYAPLDKELSGMALINNDTAIIGVNALHHPNRQRFTLAHELGHHLMHHSLINGTVHVDKAFSVLRRDALSAQGTNQFEIEANAFASELLMPNDAITAHIDVASLDIDDDERMKIYAKRFRVSVSALQYRLLALS
jgi:Zn-dependent peptidase ImmA (M78 family)